MLDRPYIVDAGDIALPPQQILRELIGWKLLPLGLGRRGRIATILRDSILAAVTVAVVMLEAQARRCSSEDPGAAVIVADMEWNSDGITGARCHMHHQLFPGESFVRGNRRADDTAGVSMTAQGAQIREEVRASRVGCRASGKRRKGSDRSKGS
jgi:hypothetical protein